MAGGIDAMNRAVGVGVRVVASLSHDGDKEVAVPSAGDALRVLADVEGVDLRSGKGPGWANDPEK